MELTNEDKASLMQFETVQTKENKEKELDQINFDKVQLKDLGLKKDEYRRVPVPRHRFTPLKQNWDSILKTLVDHMKLQVRMNVRKRAIELKTSPATADIGAIQKAADFLKAFMLGFQM